MKRRLKARGASYQAIGIPAGCDQIRIILRKPTVSTRSGDGILYGDQKIQIDKRLAARLIDLKGIRLPIPVMPVLGEAVADVIFRSAAQNGYNVPSLFFSSQYSRYLNHAVFARGLRSTENFADLLGLPNGHNDIKDLVYEHERGRCTFFGATLPVKQIISHRRVSPRALRISLHSKALWHVRSLEFDANSFEKLLDSCPVCSVELTFKFAEGVNHCHKCGPSVDLRDFPQPLVDVDDLEALQFVTGLIDPERCGNRNIDRLDVRLRTINRGQLYFLCVLGALILDGIAKKKINYKKSVSGSGVSANNLAAAGRALLNGPRGFEDIVRQYNEGYGESSLDPSAFTRLCTASNGVGSDLRKMILDDLPLISRVSAKIAAPKGATEGSGVLDLDKAFAALCASKVGTVRASRSIGVPHIVAFAAAAAGLGSREWGSFSDIDVSESKSDIGGVNQSGSGIEALSVQRCVRAMYRGAGDPWPEVLAALFGGRLPVVSLGAAKRIEDLVVADFASWSDFVKGVKGVRIHESLPISRSEACFYLGLSQNSSSRVVDAASTGTKRVTDILEIRQTAIAMEEVIDRLALQGVKLTRKYVGHRLQSAGIDFLFGGWKLRARDQVEKFYGLT